MANRSYEIAFQLGAQIQSSFNSTFTNANNQIDNLGGGMAKAMGTAAKFGAAMALAGGAAALAIGGLAVNASEDLQKSLNGLQADTGLTNEVMGNMRQAMLDIYNNNFGESFQDIGDSMGIVARQTGLTGDALESATTNALMMRDAFGMDVDGSIGAVNQLMKQFGLTSEAAYNIMAQGAQNGMNSQGDLMDVIKEYSVQFDSLGFSAEEMFNMLNNGAKAGGFSIDVMGDAMKEFNIRSKDGSKATEGAFTSLGLNAGNLTKAFAKGGTEGKKAFSDVMGKLKGIKDPIKQNAAGVALFGTMWEDLGAKGILALGNTEGKIDDAKDALARINSGKYNTFGEAMQGIKRNIETGVLIPIGEALIPTLKNFSSWITTNMPQIKSEMLKAMTVAGDVLRGAGDIITNNVMPPLAALWSWIQPNMPLIGDAIKTTMDGIGTAFSTVSDGISSLIDWCVKYSDVLIPLAAGVAAGALAFGAYSLILDGVALASTIAAGATTAFGVAVAFVTSPIGIAVIAVGLLVAAGVALYKNWDTVGVKLGQIMVGIEDVFKISVNGIIFCVNGLIGLLNKIPGFNIPIIAELQTSGMKVKTAQRAQASNRGMTQFATGGYVKHRPGGILANIGEGNEDEVVSPVSKLKNLMNSSSKNTTISNQPIQVTYSPQVNIQGNASKKDIVQALSISKGEFKKLMDEYQRGNQRLSFAR